MEKAPDNDRIEQYRRQMLEMYRQASPSSPVDETEENWLDSRYPEPNIEKDKEIVAPSEAPPPETPAFVGYLRVYAFTGGGAEPIAGARAILTRTDGTEQTVYANLLTDTDGFTPVVAVPTVDPALTLQPGTVQPYVAYTVRVTADGFQPVEHRNVPVYGDNYVTQPVAMLPILPGRDADGTQEFTSGGPTNL
ncbi:MAG: hypothetical protein IJN04_06580 [Clostridia bacterium]|nr:hypothetical protein [Clostridia bacterium]